MENLEFPYENWLIMLLCFLSPFYRICPLFLSGSITNSIPVHGKLVNMSPQEPSKALGLLSLLQRKGTETCPRSPKEICTRLAPESFILVTEMLISSTSEQSLEWYGCMEDVGISAVGPTPLSSVVNFIGSGMRSNQIFSLGLVLFSLLLFYVKLR